MEHKPYYSFPTYLKERFGAKVQRISLDAGFSCPNRDGRLSNSGCIYCDNRGFSMNTKVERISVHDQLAEGITRIKEKRNIHKFMAYFQAYTNTYASIDTLKKTYDVIRDFKDIVALAIGTRPDCVDAEILALINSYTDDYEVWIEYGLQSKHDKTLHAINRGHTCNDFIKAVAKTRVCKRIKICAHVILGLPGETQAMMNETAQLLSDLKIDAVKIHPLHVVKDTMLEKMYVEGACTMMSKNEYIQAVASFIERLSSDIVIQRVTADCPAEYLVAPAWLMNKQVVLSGIQSYFHQNSTYQGKLCL